MKELWDWIESQVEELEKRIKHMEDLIEAMKALGRTTVAEERMLDLYKAQLNALKKIIKKRKAERGR